MTVSATDSTAVFDGNGVTTNFPFNFTFDNDSEIKVYSKEVSTGVIVEVTTGFTVNGAGNDGGGSVDMDVAPATGFKLVVSRELVLEQQTDLRNLGNFFPEVHEKVFDRLTKMIQQVDFNVSRAIKTDITGEQNPDKIIADINEIAVASAASAAAAADSASAASSSAGSASSSASAASGSAAAAAASAASLVDYLNTTRIDVASASTVNLTSSAPNTRHINITGTTTITGFTVAIGQCYFVRFNAALTLTNNANIVTQTGANITTAAGDTCIIRAIVANVVEVLCHANNLAHVSSAITGTAGGLVTVNHSLGVIPDTFVGELTCTVSEGSFSVGDTVPVVIGFDHVGAAGLYGWQVQERTTSQYEVRIGGSWAGALCNKSAASQFSPTLANWTLKVTASRRAA